MTDEPATTADEPVAARPARREPSGRFALALVGAFLAGVCLTGCAGAALVAAAHAIRHERFDRDWNDERDRWHDRPEWYDRDRQYPPPPAPLPPPVPPAVPSKPPAVPTPPPAAPTPTPSRTS